MEKLIYPFFVYLNLIALLILGAFILLLLFRRTRKSLLDVFKKFGYQFIFLTSFLALFGSLSFSEVLKWPVCHICWYQRVFMYPQTLISFLAIITNDDKGYYYHFFLSLIGFLIALFHYLAQIGIFEKISCGLVNSQESCFFPMSFDFGFISIPFMAMTAFFLIILTSFFSLLSQKRIRSFERKFS
ncbi:MAG: disulfide bond formation protein B [Patescibacteria group bacterium]|nr:disulfide bond formation protein B [Patescibacteria group bacterium]